MGKSSRDKRDIFYRLAKEKGWRARSAFKLLQIDEEFGILAQDRSGNVLKRVVDLCAAPGSWSQVLSKRLWEPFPEVDRHEVKIVAVDLQAMAPIPGVIQLQGDITSRETADRIINLFEGKKAQLVICDGAPDVTGLHDLDEYVQSQLVLAALTICARILENGGTFVAKVFRGREAGLLGAQLRCLFADEVVFTKPSSSRNSSLESFVVCRNFRGDSILPSSLTSTSVSEPKLNASSGDSLMVWLDGLDQLTPEQRIILPFVACGDLSGYDADSCYELGDDYSQLDPIQPPLSAAYTDVCRRARAAAASTEEIGKKTSTVEVERVELEAMQPTWQERRLLHSIALFYFLVAIMIGLPLWWFTTSPEQFPLHANRIKAATSQAITVGVDVVVISLDPIISVEEVESLKQALYFNAADSQRSLDAQHQSLMDGDKSSNDNEARLYAGLPVRVDYRFYVSAAAATKAVPPAVEHSSEQGVSVALDRALLNSDLLVHLGLGNSSSAKHNIENAYYFIILPANSAGFKVDGGSGADEALTAVVRASSDKNLIYLRSLSNGGMSQSLASIILALLQEHLVMPSTLQAIYASVWWKVNNVDSKQTVVANNARGGINYAAAREQVAHARTYQLPATSGYEVTVSLVGAFDASPPCLPSTDDWLWTGANSQGLSLGDWLRLSVEPGLAELRRFVNLKIYSQYLYSVTLDKLVWSRLSKDRTHRYYTTSQLSNLVNSLEAYLGHHALQRGLPASGSQDDNSGSMHGGLHLVVAVDTPYRVFNASSRRPLRFHFLGSAGTNSSSVSSSIALVPQWGAFISLDDVNVSLSNLGTALVNAIHSFVGLSVWRRNVVTLVDGKFRVLLDSSSTDGKLVKWELDSWLRCRTIESLSTAALTLTSLVSTVKRVPTMVINTYVARRVEYAVAAWIEAVGELANPPSTKSASAGVKAFKAAQIALEDADAAFFDHSLLDLLYFPSDQVFGIYVPLFAPIGLPLLTSGVAALKFFFRREGRISEK